MLFRSRLRILFSNTLSLDSSLNVRDHVSPPYSTTGNIIVLYILIFKFLERSLDDEVEEEEIKILISSKWNFLDSLHYLIGIDPNETNKMAEYTKV